MGEHRRADRPRVPEGIVSADASGVRVDVDGDGIATLTFDRQDAGNSIDYATRSALRAALRALAADSAVRVIVVTGAGPKFFCTGSDLRNTPPPQESFAELFYGRPEDDHMTSTLAMDKPLIAAINGFALGGGLEIALACDLRIASDNAQMGLSEVRVGSIPAAGGTQRLPRMIGDAMAMYMLLTGERIDAATALRAGLVSHVLPPDRLLEFARALARTIAGNAPLAVRAVKRLVRDGREMPLAQALVQERQAYGLLRDTEDRLEGRAAFAARRPPTYRGR